MNFEDFAHIKTKDDFLGLLGYLVNDLSEHPEKWENLNLRDYLESVKAWAEDYEFPNHESLGWDKPSWAIVAMLFYCGKVYE